MPSDTVTAVPGFEVALFGKLPARPDFVRVNYAGRAAAELDAWLVQNVEQLHLGKVPLPGPLRFAFCSARTQHVAFGALAPSRDEAGREFPVTVFDSVPLPAVLDRLPLQVLAHEPFMNGAEAVIREAQTLAAGAPIEPSLAGLLAPGAASAAALEAAYLETLRGSSAPRFLERAFGPIDAGMHFYGCFAFLTAAAPVRDEAPDKPGTVLDCPVRSELDRMAWITFASRVLSRWRGAVPSCFWIDRPVAAAADLARPGAGRRPARARRSRVQELAHLAARDRSRAGRRPREGGARRQAAASARAVGQSGRRRLARRAAGSVAADQAGRRARATGSATAIVTRSCVEPRAGFPQK